VVGPGLLPARRTYYRRIEGTSVAARLCGLSRKNPLAHLGGRSTYCCREGHINRATPVCGCLAGPSALSECKRIRSERGVMCNLTRTCSWKGLSGQLTLILTRLVDGVRRTCRVYNGARAHASCCSHDDMGNMRERSTLVVDEPRPLKCMCRSGDATGTGIL
jgi:hypothetical protein